jgi:hypothetical protein
MLLPRYLKYREWNVDFIIAAIYLFLNTPAESDKIGNSEAFEYFPLSSLHCTET